MSTGRLPKDHRVYFYLALVFLVFLLITPKTGKFNYDYKKGSPWAYDNLVAQFDFPILKTEEELAKEKSAAGSKVIPFYRYSDQATRETVREAENIDFGKYPALKQEVGAALQDIYDRGVLDEDKDVKDEDLHASLNDVIFVQRDKRASKSPRSNVYTVATAREKLLSEVSSKNPHENVDSILRADGVYDVIAPNLIYDKETTELVHAESVDYISETEGFVSAGQLIVARGEIVTEGVKQMLDSYKAEYEDSLGFSGPGILLWMGNGIISLGIVLILFISMLYAYPAVFGKMNEYLYLLFQFLLITVVSMLSERINPQLLFLMPLTLAVLYLLAFFKKKLVVLIYLVDLLPLLVFCHNGTQLFMMFAISGTVSMLIFEHFNRSWRQFVHAVIVFAVLFTVYSGFMFMNGTRWTLRQPTYLLLGSLLCVAGYPLIYLFEKIFQLVSNSRLQELCDTNNPLLREMASKAPGTFQHSLQVMNMADAAARSIGANVLLVRAGAMYHDIGKINNPQCFIENETIGTYYHKDLSPQQSAREIIRHVSDGVVLADRYNLPEVIKDFILTHHGTTLTGYFYNKYVNAGGDPADDSAFRYNGKRPQTKEQIIVMLCDSIEAASRTLKDNKPETFDLFVENMVNAKDKDGQFEDADISIKELNILKTELKAYLSQLYHDRIAYPKRRG